MIQSTPIFCAVDSAQMPYAELIAKAMAEKKQGLKFGMEFVNTFGPQGVKAISEKYPDAPIFIDLKFHDIPNTVRSAVDTICHNITPAYLNVHALGGYEMMKATIDLMNEAGHGLERTKILAVTILTSMNNEGLKEIGINNSGDNTVKDEVLRLANLAQKAGLAGVVCSAHEIEMLRKECGDDFILMVPGIRPSYYKRKDDQKRTMTPREALDLGANHLVIGRPLTETATIPGCSTKAALQVILDEINA